TLHDGREIPMTVRRDPPRDRAWEDLRQLRLATPAGVLPLEAIADIRRMPPAPAIVHHNGRREVKVAYTLAADVPTGGPARLALDAELRRAVQDVHRPAGYTIETPAPEASYSWFRRILVPVLLLLFAVLAVTFESLTMPLLVLLSLPLTLLGATWALVLSGTPPDMMALVGALALIGLTVNPAILLVDRMQQRAWIGGRSSGAAALAAVRERARAVLMTTATTVAGLWPLALVTGQENEIWPPFATIVMGGLVTSTLLTLLAIPVGFVFMRRFDEMLGRLGPWIIIGWALATAAIVVPLFETEQIVSLTWQIVTTVLVASGLLLSIVFVFRRKETPEPDTSHGPPEVDVRYLSKIYGKPGPIGRAWHAGSRFAGRVQALGGKPFDPRVARDRLIPLSIVLAGVLYLVVSVQTVFWSLFFLFVAAGLASALLIELRRARGGADELGRVLPGGAEGVAAAAVPWIAALWAGISYHLLPRLAEERVKLAWWVWAVGALVLLVVQFGRRNARRIARGEIDERVERGKLRRTRTAWRKLSRRLFGLDLPAREIRAVTHVHFKATGGMIGVLGPNGAGKTTLLRNLAGILEPSLGTITVGGVPLGRLRRYLARFVGYLPQDFGLPHDLTAREYLEYYALHYEIRPDRRRERVERLLREVGLAERAGEKIGSYSGGMRQRVAVARTLLRLPPVIIVDEPTVGLDPRERIRFRNLLSRLAEGRIVLFSTHVVEDVEVACERVIVMAHGRIVFDGEPGALAGAAEGKVWVARLGPGEADADDLRALVVDQVPEADGTVRIRMLHDRPPRAGAEPVAPSLEDGYLWLVRGTA
ncbi:MAG TPA: efflux RND transporter permease subunit, partial [Candidatus Polarisedimenticolaceae bacterium]|nr:efflux RND transporter permease subunit [Candidatus Polarisedimenticolaceae bacterium]